MATDVSNVNALLSSLAHEAPPNVRGLRSAGTAPRVENADAAEEFEAYLLRMLLGEMRKTIGDGGLFGSSHTQRYTALLDDALAKRAAEAHSFGLAEQMLNQLETRS